MEVAEAEACVCEHVKTVLTYILENRTYVRAYVNKLKQIHSLYCISYRDIILITLKITNDRMSLETH